MTIDPALCLHPRLRQMYGPVHECLECGLKDHWRGNREICLFVGPRTCTRCGFGELILFPTFTEDALFRHGGYGESIRRTVGDQT